MGADFTLHHGDCLDVLPTLADGSVDCVLTDPPYGIGNLNKFGTRGGICKEKHIKYVPIIGDDKPFDPSPFLSFPIVCLWGANWYSDKLPSNGRWLVWDKREGGQHDNGSDAELAWCNKGNTVRLLHHKWRGMLKASEKGEPRYHITQKPIALMEWCMDVLEIPQGATVFDPFMGSGTTGIACLRRGINFIGIEIDRAIFDIAQKRIDTELSQGRLFDG